MRSLDAPQSWSARPSLMTKRVLFRNSSGVKATVGALPEGFRESKCWLRRVLTKLDQSVLEEQVGMAGSGRG